MNPYNPVATEEKWLTTWKESKLFQGTAEKQANNKFYALFAFAYPSGSGLHVGHVESMAALDIYVRYLRMQGKDVFFPVGWDAFGLPAENYAIKTGVPPAKTTFDSIHNFERQVERVGISYDWESEVATCHPGYYKWTQWIFIQLFKKGLAYRDVSFVNWCPQDKTVLANEQVVNGTCERCGASVIQKELEQWKFRITKYQDELISGLDQVDWPTSTKEQQKNWIGKSKGLQISFKLATDASVDLAVWTKFWETIFGVTFVVIAPEKFKEMGLLARVDAAHKHAVDAYLDIAAHKTEEERRVGEKDKTGVDTGLTVINPANGESVPLFIADYVLMNVGTGVVMGVPSHDERDFQFAKKFALPTKQVVSYADEVVNAKVNAGEAAAEGEGTLVNSSQFDGLSAWGEGKTKMAEWMIEQGVAEWKTTYKLRDWLISRQRYWGAPIPMVHCEACAKSGKGEQAGMPGWYAVEENSLPVVLPDVPDFQPTDDGHSPIEKASDAWKFVTCPGCGGSAQREVDTMDTFVDSSWYFLRYTDARNEDVFARKEQIEKWMPVDTYLIGPEHTVLHLLYSRFFTKFLRDEGYLKFDEPFMKMRHQGMILGPDGKKMSKSKGNVINPDDVISKFGADTLRVYEMFMGPLDADKAWDTSAVAGVYRFLSRIYGLVHKNIEGTKTSNSQADSVVVRKLNKTIKKVGEDIPEYRFNTAIAMMMEFVNLWAQETEKGIFLSQDQVRSFVAILAPFAPFMCEELWSLVGGTGSVHTSAWPTFDPGLIVDAEVSIAVQVNGKVRSRFMIASDLASDDAIVQEHALKSLAEQGTTIDAAQAKIFVVKGKLVNIVVAT